MFYQLCQRQSPYNDVINVIFVTYPYVCNASKPNSALCVVQVSTKTDVDDKPIEAVIGIMLLYVKQLS